MLIKVAGAALVLAVSLFLMPWWLAVILGFATYIGLDQLMPAQQPEDDTAVVNELLTQLRSEASKLKHKELQRLFLEIAQERKIQPELGTAPLFGLKDTLTQVISVLQSYKRYDQAYGETESDDTIDSVKGYLAKVLDRLQRQDLEDQQKMRENLSAEVKAHITVLHELEQTLGSLG